jgi:hypothetical protein
VFVLLLYQMSGTDTIPNVVYRGDFEERGF